MLIAEDGGFRLCDFGSCSSTDAILDNPEVRQGPRARLAAE